MARPKKSLTVPSAYAEMMLTEGADMMLTTEQAARYLKLTPQTLRQYRNRKIGPAYSRTETGVVLYASGDLIAYVKSRRRAAFDQSDIDAALKSFPYMDDQIRAAIVAHISAHLPSLR